MKETVTVIGASTSVGKRLAAELLKEQNLSVNLCFDKYSDAVCHAGNPAARCFVGNLAQTRNELKVLQVTSTGDNRLVNLDTVLQSSELIVISEYTSCFPSLDWVLGKSPQDVNVKMVRNVVNGCGSRLRKLVFLSALGAKRKLSKLPKLDANILFWVLNFFGALDAIRQGEEIVCEAGRDLSIQTSIIRAKFHCYLKGPFGGMNEEMFDEMEYQSLELLPGDIADGETSDLAAALTLKQALVDDCFDNKDVAVVNSPGSSPLSPEEWNTKIQSLLMREKQLLLMGERTAT